MLASRRRFRSRSSRRDAGRAQLRAQHRLGREARQAEGASDFVDYTHAETGARLFKAQHPELELWNQGIHARSGVSCSDCHMPYMRVGASKVSDHWVRSPLLNINRACQTCHKASEAEIAARVDVIQSKNHGLLQRGGEAIVDLIDAIVAARKAGLDDDALGPALHLQRKAQWRLDYIASENSMGFHAPQEAARILGEAAGLCATGAGRRSRGGAAPPTGGEPGRPLRAACA